MLLRKFRHLVVVNILGFGQPIGNRVVELSREIHRRAVREVATVCQRHAKNRVARLQCGEVHRLICLRARVRLHVGDLGFEQRLGAIDRQPLRDVHVLAAAVVAFAGIAFGVLVGEHRTLRLQHARAGVVLRCDQLDVIFLALAFRLQCLPQIGVEIPDVLVNGKHGDPREKVGSAGKRRIVPFRSIGPRVKGVDPNGAATGKHSAKRSVSVDTCLQKTEGFSSA